MTGSSSSFDVVVIGSGASGLTVASRLQAQFPSLSIVVLEARDRIGGRTWSDPLAASHDKQVFVDLGASWVHHSTDRNPFAQLCRATNAKLLVQDEDIVLYDADGSRVPHEEGEKMCQLADALLDSTRCWAALAQKSSGDTHIRDFSVQEAYAPAHRALTESNPRTRRLVNWWLHDEEQWMGVLFDKLSVLHWEDPRHAGGYEGDLDEFVASGSGNAVCTMAAGLNVLRNKVVVELVRNSATDSTSLSAGQSARNSKVTVRCADGSRFTAQFVVCTVPIGVLQSGAIDFIPALPPVKVNAIAAIGAAVMNKIVLTFSCCFWNPKETYFGYASEQHGYFPWFLNLIEATGTPSLMMFVVGEFASQVELWDDKRIIREVCTVLFRIWGPQHNRDSKLKSVDDMVHSMLVGHKITRWQADPFARCSWSVHAVGSSSQKIAALNEPEWDNALYFAGEHCSITDQGCVHGAMLTGITVANHIAAQLAKTTPSPTAHL